MILDSSNPIVDQFPLLDALPYLIWMVDINQKGMYYNKAWLEFSGHSLEQERAKGWPWGMHPEDLARCSEIYKDAFRLQQPFEMEYRYLHKDGNYRWLLDTGRPLFGPDGSFHGYIGSCQDITEQKQVLHSLQESEERYRTLFAESPVPLWEEDFSQVKKYLDQLQGSGICDVSAYFAQHPEDLSDCIGLIRVLGANRAAAELYHAKGKEDHLRNFHKYIASTEAEVGIGIFTAVAQGEKHFKRQVIQELPNGEKLYVDKHWVVMPGYDQDYSRVLASGVDVSDHKLLEAKTRQSAYRSESLAIVARQINAHLDIKTVLSTVCEEAARVLDLPAAGVLLADEKRDILHVSTVYGIPPGFPDSYDEISQSYYSRFKHPSRPSIVIPDVQSIPDLPNAALYDDFGIRSIAGAGIIHDEKLIGVLLVCSLHETKVFSMEDQLLLQAFADQAAVAIQNARLFAETNRRAKQLEALANMTSSLRQAEALDEIIPLIINKAQEVFSADCVTLLMQKGQHIEVAASWGGDLGKIRERFHSDSTCRQILSGTYLFFSSNADIQQYLSGINSSSPVQRITEEAACALAPLKTARASIGLLHLGYKRPHKFAAEEKRLLAALSEMISNTLQRAEAMNTLERRVTDRTRELETLYQIASTASENLTIHESLERSLSIILPSVGAISGKVHLIVNETDLEPVTRGRGAQAIPGLHLIAEYSTAEDVSPAPLSTPTSDELTSRVVRHGEVLAIPNIVSDSIAGYSQFIIENPPWFIGLPIRRSEEMIGVLSIYGQKNRLFSAEDIALLSTISDQLGVVIENARLRHQAERGVLIAERQRLARELHDSITQVLYSLSIFAGAGQNLAQDRGYEKILTYFKRIEQNTQLALKEMRLLIYELRPSILEEEGLKAALQRRLEAVENKAGITTDLIIEEGDYDLPAHVESELYRIAQEALNNTLKHAEASTVTVQLFKTEEMFVMEISDNGIGFDRGNKTGSGGYGLQSMRERAAKIGGTLSISSAPKKGTRVKLEVRR